MPIYAPYLSWIEAQKGEMVRLVSEWGDINSGSYHLQGLSMMLNRLKDVFRCLDGQMEEIELPDFQQLDNEGKLVSCPLGKALHIQKRPEAPFQVLLAGHMDTVYPLESSFQKTFQINERIMTGPGVADMKGGLVVLLKALQAFEMSPYAGQLGWEILINPDEEIASPGSQSLFRKYAKNKRFGLIFEPSLPDGSLVVQRMGSSNFSVRASGKAAHVGRDFSQGNNAIHSLASLIHILSNAASKIPDFIFNTGSIRANGTPNVVPDYAFCKFNIRSGNPSELIAFEKSFEEIRLRLETESKVRITILKETSRPPKPLTPPISSLFEHALSCAQQLNISLEGKSSGGVTDGNILAEAGLPNLDTMGVRGGKLHTPEEYLEIDSLTERAKLTALFLMQWQSLSILHAFKD